MKTQLAISITTLLSSALLVTSIATATPQFKTGSEAEVSYDGLHRIDDSDFDAAWARPDIDLRRYTKIMLLPAGMSFKPVANHSSTDFEVTDRQKQMLHETLLEAFTKELGKSSRYTLTDQAGPDVLLIGCAVLDVVSHVPPERAGRGGYALKSIGEATLVVELRDSVNGEILARAVDRRAASSAFLRRSNSVTNASEVRLAAQRWASLVSQRLDDLSKM